MLTLNNFCTPLPDNEITGSKYTNDEILNAVGIIQLNNKNRETEKAMSMLIKQFYNYIVKCATAIDAANVDDKIIAGCEGLLYAARNFDLSKGSKFFTYAYTCISGYMKWDFRHGRLIKIPSTKIQELRKPENAEEFRRLSNPLSLNTGIGNSDSEENKKEHETFLSDGIDYEEESVSSTYYAGAADIMKEIIMQETDEACPGVTYADIYCHVNELFGYTFMKPRDAADYFGISENNIRNRCRRIKQRIYSNRKLRNYIDFKDPYATPIDIPSVYSDRYGQMFLNLSYKRTRKVSAPKRTPLPEFLPNSMSIADYKKDYQLRKEEAKREQLSFDFD